MAKKPTAPAPGVTIRCTQPGFRRAAQAHPEEATYPAGHFSAEQLEELQAEPRLIVTIVEEPKA